MNKHAKKIVKKIWEIKIIGEKKTSPFNWLYKLKKKSPKKNEKLFKILELKNKNSGWNIKSNEASLELKINLYQLSK